MGNLFKNIIILVCIILAILGIYFGAFMPLAKSQSFISAQQKIQIIKSVDEFKKVYDVPLTMSSPIGQEEVVKFSASTVGDILGSVGKNEPVARWFVSYIEPFAYRNELRHQLLMGNMYEFLWQSFGHQEADFKKAEAYYIHANELGPKSPPPLYRLVSLYQQKGDQENLNKYGNIILSYWDDPKVREAVK